WPHDPVVQMLEALVSRARIAVYESASRTTSAREFIRRGYWTRVRERSGALALAAVLLFLPLLVASIWGVVDPQAAINLVPGEYRGVVEEQPGGQDLELSPQEAAAFSTFIFTNNIQVTFVSFAGGVLAGLGTAWILLYNGTFIGAVAGLSIGAGNGLSFLELVVAHGVLELSCIVVAGGAGLSLGSALISPGYRRRIDAVVTEAHHTVAIVVGTAPRLVVAGLVEGFVTPGGYGFVVVLTVGLSLGALYWALVWLLGTPDPRAELAASPAGTH
ncbi:MAG: stage II sporulation protein M, partial [Actinomycetota bacterium]|nr:stage II sporulation protein M [Actinomycetota bacterium]